MRPTTLTDLGLTAAQESCYRYFLRHPGSEPDDVHLILHLEADEVVAVIAELVKRGLLLGDPERRALRAERPATVISRLTDERLEHVHAQIALLGHTHALQAELDLLGGAQESLRITAELVPTVEAVRERLQDLSFFARSEIMSLEPYERLTPENIEHSRPLDLRCLRRSLTVRSVIRSEALHDPTTEAHIRSLVSAGAQIRHLPKLDDRVIIFDRRAAVVPENAHGSESGAVVLHQSTMVNNCITLFEQRWDQAQDVPPADSVRSECAREIDLDVLHAMCFAAKDESAAAELGLSVRTYRRRVADLLSQLGAGNRVEAALIARERGWI